ncbi:hypothetical protein H9K76_18440 [Diaphorobacter ruginosibacter]|uniref:Tail assembly chaperone n=1 Tax=Diaphorobacter ruginosibacter TaxID=1715720 RepID=A0A7G9RLM1_9BURK|nr:phage tail assembly chaperone [Diaphorobacter ruginosibacter]QNN56496.1 hypothetical protein H9K76_18440 [Diaphorobacter ruginosibacter]
MAKIILGKRPETFKRKVKFPMLDGSEGVITCDFVYRTKKEFGELIDLITKDAKAEEQGGDVADSLGSILSKTIGKNAEYLLQILKDWDVDAPLNQESAEQLSDELPGATAAIMETYRVAIADGRLGN